MTNREKDNESAFLSKELFEKALTKIPDKKLKQEFMFRCFCGKKFFIETEYPSQAMTRLEPIVLKHFLEDSKHSNLPFNFFHISKEK